MAFDRDAQLPGDALCQPDQVTLGLGDLRQDRIGQLQQAFSGGGEAYRRGLAFEQRRAVMVFQLLDLMG